jgi:DHA2 family lincomycin resistance protein-like MFS transporter
MRQEQDQTIAKDQIQKIRVVPLLAVLLSGAFMAILNETLLNVAISPIMDAFGVEASTAQWLTTGYLLVVAVLVPVSAFLIQRFTTRQLFYPGSRHRDPDPAADERDISGHPA